MQSKQPKEKIEPKEKPKERIWPTGKIEFVEDEELEEVQRKRRWRMKVVSRVPLCLRLSFIVRTGSLILLGIHVCF